MNDIPDSHFSPSCDQVCLDELVMGLIHLSQSRKQEQLARSPKV